MSLHETSVCPPACGDALRRLAVLVPGFGLAAAACLLAACATHGAGRAGAGANKASEVDVAYRGPSNMVIKARKGSTTVDMPTLVNDKVHLKEGDTVVIRPLEQSPTDLKLP